jgi:hypothetical protein
MLLGILVNIATAAMEDIYERLCWVYTTLRCTLGFDHRGLSYKLRDISDLSRGKIPYPEQFSKKPDYQQESLIQDLLMKDILFTRTDWINLGRYLSNLELCQYADGDEKYISIEGVPYQNPMRRAGYIIEMVQKIPNLLLSAGAQQSSYW